VRPGCAIASARTFDREVRQSVDGLLNAGCTCSKPAELITREIDLGLALAAPGCWSPHPGRTSAPPCWDR